MVTHEEALARIEQLEAAILEASLLICESRTAEAHALMRIFGNVMDEDARKRVGI